MIVIKRTNNQDDDFRQLVAQLDAYLAKTDGDEHGFYNQYNGLDGIKCAVVAYIDGTPVGCGAFKQYNKSTVEVKRMYSAPDRRGQGIGRKILQELEDWAAKLGYERVVLETGKRQTEAVRFYPSLGYTAIENYGQYQGMDNSLCFSKQL